MLCSRTYSVREGFEHRTFDWDLNVLSVGNAMFLFVLYSKIFSPFMKVFDLSSLSNMLIGIICR